MGVIWPLPYNQLLLRVNVSSGELSEARHMAQLYGNPIVIISVSLYSRVFFPGATYNQKASHTLSFSVKPFPRLFALMATLYAPALSGTLIRHTAFCSSNIDRVF